MLFYQVGEWIGAKPPIEEIIYYWNGIFHRGKWISWGSLNRAHVRRLCPNSTLDHFCGPKSLPLKIRLYEIIHSYDHYNVYIISILPHPFYYKIYLHIETYHIHTIYIRYTHSTVLSEDVPAMPVWHRGPRELCGELVGFPPRSSLNCCLHGRISSKFSGFSSHVQLPWGLFSIQLGRSWSEYIE